MELGFFASLFQQFVALLSVFCIAPSNAPNIAAADLGPPGSPTVQVAEYISADPSVAVRQQPFIARVVQTQVDGLLGTAVSAGRSPVPQMQSPGWCSARHSRCAEPWIAAGLRLSGQVSPFTASSERRTSRKTPFR